MNVQDHVKFLHISSPSIGQFTVYPEEGTPTFMGLQCVKGTWLLFRMNRSDVVDLKNRAVIEGGHYREGIDLIEDIPVPQNKS